jgi:hypothetical protein
MTAENCLRSKSCYTLTPKAEKARSPGKRARSLGWINTAVEMSPANPHFSMLERSECKQDLILFFF